MTRAIVTAAILSLTACSVELREGTVMCGPAGNECPDGWYCDRSVDLCRRGTAPLDAGTERDGSPADAGIDSGEGDGGPCPAPSVSDHDWGRVFEGSGASAIEGIAFAGTSVVAVGWTSGPIDLGCGPVASESVSSLKDAFVARISSRGVVEWARVFGGDADDAFHGVAVGGSGIAIVGTFGGTVSFGEDPEETHTSVGRSDAVVVRLDPADGHTLWAKRIGGTDDEEATAIAASGSEICVTGLFRGTVVVDEATTWAGTADTFVACFHDDDGTLSSSDTFGGRATDIGRSLAMPSDTALFVVGTGREPFAPMESLGSADAFIVRYDGRRGTRARGPTLLLGGAGDDQGIAVAADASSVYVLGKWAGAWTAPVGALGDAGAPEDAFVLALDHDLSTVPWASAIRASVDGDAVQPPGALFHDGSELSVGGTFTGTLDVGGSSPVVTTAPQQGFLARFALSTGSPTTLLAIDATIGSRLLAGAPTTGATYVAGDLAGQATFPRSLTSSGTTARAFVAAVPR